MYCVFYILKILACCCHYKDNKNIIIYLPCTKIASMSPRNILIWCNWNQWKSSDHILFEYQFIWIVSFGPQRVFCKTKWEMQMWLVLEPCVDKLAKQVIHFTALRNNRHIKWTWNRPPIYCFCWCQIWS